MKQITSGSLDISVNFSHGLPCFDHGTHFVMGKIHAVAVSQAGFCSDHPQ